MRGSEIEELRQRIASRWPTADGFYAERDDRTVRLVGPLTEYATRPVEIVVDPAAADDVTVQRIALVAANLTVRWARRVRVVGGVKGIEREMSMANPFFDATPAETGALRLFVGPWRAGVHGGSANDFQVHAAAWTALGMRLGDRKLVGECGSKVGQGADRVDATVAAAALAGALGAGDLFKRAVGHDRGKWLRTFAWDTWSSELELGKEAWGSVVARPVLEVLDVGRLLLAGVGAIGSAIVYIMGMMRMSGMVTLFDRDRVDGTNLNRSPLFTVLDAYESAAKTTVAKRWLERRDSLSVEAIDGIWRDHAGKFGEMPFDIWISLTNEDGAWANVPFQLPPVVFHGTTTSGWGFSAGRHIPRVEDCTMCRMPRPEAEFRGVCATGQLVPGPNGDGAVGPVASLPFLSTASAALVLAMMMQLSAAGASAAELPNQLSVDLSAGLPALIRLNRMPTEGCRGCKALRSSAWLARRGSGRYAHLSR